MLKINKIKFKKILLVFISVFLLTGCGADYMLIIDGDTYKDELFIHETQKNVEKLNDASFDKLKGFMFALQQYNQNYKIIRNFESNEKIGYKYISEGKIEEYADQSFIKLFYNKVKVEEKNGILTIEANNDGEVSEESEAKPVIANISIKTNRRLIETNATKKNGNTYTWQFTLKDGPIENQIYIKLGNKKLITGKTIILSIGIIALISLITIFIIKRKKSNEV